MFKSIVVLAIIAFASCSMEGNFLGETPETVPYVNLTLLEGVWYQWAHEITLFQNADYCAYYNFTVVDGKLTFTYFYKDGDGETPWKSMTPSVTSENSTSNAKYKVVYSTLNQLSYWFLDVDPAYNHALIGSPNLKYATVLCRENLYNDTLFYDLSAKAGAFGYKNDSWRFPYQGRACTAPYQALEY